MNPGRTTRTLLSAIAAVFLAVTAADAQLGRPEGLYYKSWAVIFGINDYLLAPKLTTPVADGKVLAAALRKLGFEEVVEVYDKQASFKSMQYILNDVLLRKVGRQDRVVIFYAGHAGVTRDSSGKDLGYLVPWDAQINNAAKAVTLDDLKDFSRRVMSKHILFIINAGVSGWDITAPQQLSLEGRGAPEEETDKRAVQVLTAANKGEATAQKDGQSLFLRALTAGLQGAADTDKNGWLMVSELGTYSKQQVEKATAGKQHPQIVRLDGDGDMILVEGKRGTFRAGGEPKTDAERVEAAKELYDLAFTTLQQQRPPQEALNSLNKALEYNPTYGDAYILKSYVLMEYLSNQDDALIAANQAVKYAAENPDSHYTQGLILLKKQQYKEAEQAMQRALALNPDNSDALLVLGDLYAEDLKDQNKALESYRKYLETGGTEARAKDYIEKAGTK
ncbi:MAG: tetratricopeptide repeat protein [Nitrospiraceae bacterium]|nr:tetratricopeptide repeat protein [Nitrospiraceae bacterium]